MRDLIAGFVVGVFLAMVYEDAIKKHIGFQRTLQEIRSL